MTNWIAAAAGWARGLSRKARSDLGYAGGSGSVAAGVGIEVGVGWGLVCAGAAMLVWALVLYDVGGERR